MTSPSADHRGADHRGAGNGSRVRAGRRAACSAATAASVGLICASTGPVRLAGGLILLASFVGAMWIAHRARFAAVAPAIGLALAALILIGLVLAAFHALSTDPVALAIGAVTLAVPWASSRYPLAEPRDDRTPAGKRASTAAIGGVVIFAAAGVLAVHFSATSATADSAGASSLAVWAYPSGGQLHVGAQQPAGHGPTSLRIVVIQAGTTAAAWYDVRLAPGQTWRPPPLTIAGNGPARLVARHDGVVVASLSIATPRNSAAAHPTLSAKQAIHARPALSAKPARHRSADPAPRAPS